MVNMQCSRFVTVNRTAQTALNTGQYNFVPSRNNSQESTQHSKAPYKKGKPLPMCFMNVSLKKSTGVQGAEDILQLEDVPTRR
jgi:hypothetical protein